MNDVYHAPQRELARLADSYGLILDYEFVPQNFPAGTKATEMGMKWRVTVSKGGKALLTTDYSQGIAHCPSYPKKYKGAITVADYEAIRKDCLLGPESGEPKNPLDALWCIVSDCQGVANSSGFEDWAGEYGYDTDSRKAEAIFRQVSAQWMALRAAIGDDGIEALASVEM